MDSFRIELVSIASVQRFPDDTPNSFTKFSPEYLNLEDQ